MLSANQHSIRDPVHKCWISYSDDEEKIIDSPIFQRTRHLKQLTCAHLVFAGEHTRFWHSLGAMHIAGKYAEHIYFGNKDRAHIVQLARLCGLLHDVGHGCFSHGWEMHGGPYAKLYPGKEKGHDEHRKIIVRGVLASLIEMCGVSPQEIIDVWEGKDPVIKAIINGPVGADRMDFIQRDSYMCGTAHFGTIADERIIKSSLIMERDGVSYLHYKEKVADDIMQALMGRFQQYKNVYLHKSVVAAGLLMEKMIEHSMGPLKLVEKTREIDQFVDLTDDMFFGMLRFSNVEGLEKARYYMDRLYKYRDLPKMVYEELVSKKKVYEYKNPEDIDLHDAVDRYLKETLFSKATDDISKIPIYQYHMRPLSTLQSRQFDQDKIFIASSNNESITFGDYLEKTHYFKQFSDPTLDDTIIIRVYTDEQYLENLKKLLSLIPDRKETIKRKRDDKDSA